MCFAGWLTESQQMAELPKERLEASAPFTYSGADCFGLFIVRKACKEYKRYGLIFTRLYSRAVRMEMLEGFSTDSFINTLRCTATKAQTLLATVANLRKHNVTQSYYKSSCRICVQCPLCQPCRRCLGTTN